MSRTQLKILKYINQLVECKPRLGKNLIKAEKLITAALENRGFTYKLQRLRVLPPQSLASEFRIKVPIEKHETNNVFVGNLFNPKAILLTHFDAIGPGALDNASGVAVSLAVLVNNPDFIKNNLVVFSGCEEVSQGKPVYWGYGYRRFEQEYKGLLRKCRAIYVVDCVGNGRLNFFQGDYYFRQAMPLKDLALVKHKAFVLTGSVKKLLEVCHSNKDTVEKLKEKYLEASYKQLVKVCYQI